ncbi:MAG: GIY-YIG nuclease family protein [Taibaiella sp.]|nr:GIY-YIG nuclease family protein [Taibaiella sp.]
MFYLYILYSERTNKYYIGHSEDPWERVMHHNTDDKTTYTAKYRPWKISAVFEAGATRAEALSIERFIKKQKSRNLIEELVDPGFVPTERLAQLVRVPHVRD